jgi:GNAT superfamily N-acetyltransferase
MKAADRAQVTAWKRALWGDDGGGDDETVFVWESDTGLLGGFVSVSLRPWAEGCAGAPVPYIEGLYVTEDLRRQGIGRALIQQAEAWAREGGFAELGSDVPLDNPISLQAHRRLGFVPTERLQFFRKSLDPAEPTTAMRVEHHAGPRSDLRSLFELAEDSPTQLDSYLDCGRVLVAVAGEEILGHLQLIETELASEAEIKNMAVLASHRRRGIGRKLITMAIQLAREESRHTVRVATAAADLDNLRFYQQLGFRMRSIERDAFTPAAGYDPGTIVDGVELRDRVWLELSLDDAPRP